MSANTRESDPFAALGHNTIPRGGLDADFLSHGGSSSLPGTRPTTTTPVSAPRPLQTLTGTSYRTGTSGDATKVPWYLRTAWIVALVVALLLALGLGVGLGVGLGARSDRTDSSGSEAARAGSGSTVTSYSTYSSIVTGPAATTFVPAIETDTRSRSASVVIETVGGSTVTAIQRETQGAGSGVLVTVSETLAPSTRTNIVFVTTFPSTQTITTTLAGGVAQTVFETVTVRRTVTALATATP
ncbi:hypothetical protein JCM11491_002724 [Sporobolomyces phaffii]